MHLWQVLRLMQFKKVDTLINYTIINCAKHTETVYLHHCICSCLCPPCTLTSLIFFYFTVKIVCIHCFFPFPCSLIFEYFSGKDPNSKDNSVGLQLLGIVLANDLPPYDPACGIEHDRYTLKSSALDWHV